MDHSTIFLLQCAAAILCVLISVAVLLRCCRSKAARGDAVLLAGISDAGKTVLFHRLRDNKLIESHTSQKENSGRFAVASGTDARELLFIDFPGHPRLRPELWQRIEKVQLRAVIFLVDATNVEATRKDAGEYLFNLLVLPQVQQRHIPVLIAVHKSDVQDAASVDEVRTALTSELNGLCKTHSSDAGLSDTAAEKPKTLGFETEAFSFDALSNPVTFLQTNAQDDAGAKPIIDWLIQSK
nr:SRb [Gefionella okellyi]